MSTASKGNTSSASSEEEMSDTEILMAEKGGKRSKVGTLLDYSVAKQGVKDVKPQLDVIATQAKIISNALETISVAELKISQALTGLGEEKVDRNNVPDWGIAVGKFELVKAGQSAITPQDMMLKVYGGGGQ